MTSQARGKYLIPVFLFFQIGRSHYFANNGDNRPEGADKMYHTKTQKPLMYLIFLLAMIINVIFPTTKSTYAIEMEFKSKAALLMEYNSGNTIYSLNIDEKLFPASITKIMTLLLALEALQRGDISLQDEVPITQNAESMGGAQLFLSQGDVVDMESLLIGIAVGSANDAAVAVAEYVAGSERAFVDMMNKRAAELAMENTYFCQSNRIAPYRAF